MELRNSAERENYDGVWGWPFSPYLAPRDDGRYGHLTIVRHLFSLIWLGPLAPIFASAAGAQAVARYEDASQPIDARVSDLLRRMTLEEKVAQMEAIAPGPGRGLDSLLGGGDTAMYGAKGKRLSFGAITGAPRACHVNARTRSTESSGISSREPDLEFRFS